MSSLIPSNSPTMSSREIAELTGKRHDHVMRDIRVMLVELHGEGGLPRFGDTHANEQNGQSYPIFRLPKREVEILVTGYSIPLRAKVIDRLHELEAQMTQPSLNPANLSRLQLIELALQAEQERLAIEQKAIALEHRVETLEPKAEALDRISGSEGSLNITEAAKALGVKPKALFGKLQANRWIYKRQGGRNWLGYQDKCQQGLVEHKVSTVTMPDGTEKISEQVRVTPKGITRLSTLLNGGAS